MAIYWTRMGESEPMHGELVLVFYPDTNEFSVGRFSADFGDCDGDNVCWFSFPEPPGWTGGYLGLHT